MAKKWYVFSIDCFGSFKTALEAAAYAENLSDAGFDDIEIRQFTADEFAAYCEGGQKKLDSLRSAAK